jgi:LysM repeat protein
MIAFQLISPYHRAKYFVFSILWRWTMSVKMFAQTSMVVLLLLAFLGTPLGAQASGACGGSYIVNQGDTLNSLAAKCGTSVSAITAANPGVSDPLRSGQSLTLPGSGSSGSSVNSTIVSGSSTNISTNTNSNSSPIYSQPTYNNGTYIIQYGDTFSAIASRYGLSVNQLWAANTQIWNINYLYAGQLIYLPGYSASSAAVSTPLSYGTVPAGTRYGKVRLINKSSGDFFVSLQGTTRDGVKVINEYDVSKSMTVKVPSGWYVYVAWVGGQKYEGQFQLGGDSDYTLTFYNDKISGN